VVCTGRHAAVSAGAVPASSGAAATAFAIARPGSTVGVVGVPHGIEVPFNDLFFRNVGVRGGPAPVRRYAPQLLDDVLEGRIHPGLVFDFETDLEGIAEAYAAMDERRAVKSLVRVGSL
jgi:threonine dehydrogenase-like Zn-dependent dehydrogenase